MNFHSDPSGQNRRRYRVGARVVLILASLVLLAVGCDSAGPSDPPEAPRTRPEVSLATSPENTEETTSASMDQYAEEETTSGEVSSEGGPDVILRLEGEKGTRFTGICGVGDERNVVSGGVPRRFEFALDGGELKCEIQKRTGSGGSLRVVLVSDGKTRSVQQTSSAGGEVRLNYSS